MPEKRNALAVMCVLMISLAMIAVPAAATGVGNTDVTNDDLGAAHGGWGEIGDEVVTGAAAGVAAGACVASGGVGCGAVAAAGYLATQATDDDKDDGLHVPS